MQGVILIVAVCYIVQEDILNSGALKRVGGRTEVSGLLVCAGDRVSVVVCYSMQEVVLNIAVC